MARATSPKSVLLAAILALWTTGAGTATTVRGAETPPPAIKPPPDLSLRHEVANAIEKGLSWMEKNQDAGGWWSSADTPALTALALTAYELRPHHLRDSAVEPAFVQRGYAWLAGCAQADGGLYRKEMSSYNTSVALVALVARGRPEDKKIILAARNFLASLQQHAADGQSGDPFDGGIGYGKTEKRPDLSNTSLALEAMALSGRYLRSQKEDKKGPASAGPDELRDLDWKAVVRFIQSCQNLPSQNAQAWVSDLPQEKGGFVYAPGRSMAGTTNLPSGRTALRSYGSMSYAGLLSYVYADLKRDDPRVTAVREWLGENYTLQENPGMGSQGLYYYLHTMAKALTAAGEDSLTTRDGRSIRWRDGLALRLMDLQQSDGHWANQTARWFEKDPVLVTAYSLMALDIIHDRL